MELLCGPERRGLCLLDARQRRLQRRSGGCPEAHPLGQSCSLTPRGEPVPRGCRGEAAAERPEGGGCRGALLRWLPKVGSGGLLKDADLTTSHHVDLAIQALAADEIKNAELKAAEEKRAAEATAAATLSALEAKREAALAKAAEERERALAAAAKREGEARRAVEEKAAQLALLKREKRVAAEKKRAADKRRDEKTAATAAEVCTHSRHGLGK